MIRLGCFIDYQNLAYLLKDSYGLPTLYVMWKDFLYLFEDSEINAENPMLTFHCNLIGQF